MTDPIKALIEAGEAVADDRRFGGVIEDRKIDALRMALFHAKAAAEARPEPKPDDACDFYAQLPKGPTHGRFSASDRADLDNLKRKAFEKARPEPKPVRHCAKCGRPENAHDVRHVFVGTGEPIRPEPAAEPSEVAKLIHQGHEFLNASAVLPAVRAALRALEALVREVRE